MVNRRFYRLNFGYRSIVDWQPTQGISQGSAQDRWPKSGASEMVGAYSFAETGRPAENQPGSGGRTDAKLPGEKGIYWDVRFWNRPSIKFSKDDPDAYFRAMGRHAQQWLYLASEKMAAEAGAAISLAKEIGSIDSGTASSLETFLGSSDAGGRRLGTGMTKGATEINYDPSQDWDGASEPIKKGYSPKWDAIYEGRVERQGGSYNEYNSKVPSPTDSGAVQDAFTKGDFRPDISWTGGSRGKVRARTDTQEGYYDESGAAQRQVSVQLRRMMAGLGSSKYWIKSFTNNVYKRGPKHMRRMAKEIDDYILGEFKIIAKELGLTQSDVKKAASGISSAQTASSTWGSRAITALPSDSGYSEGGSVMERGSVRAGLAKSPDDSADMYKGGKVSKPIDLELLEEVTHGGISYTKLDVTKSIWSRDKRTGQHGTAKGVPYTGEGLEVFGANNIPDLIDNVRSHYNNDRIPLYNAIIQMIRSVTGIADDDKRARERMGAATMPSGGWERVMGEGVYARGGTREKQAWIGGENPRVRNATGQLLRHLRAMDQRVLRSQRQLIQDTARGEVFEAMKWVLHHMGQDWSSPENYGNMMGIGLPDGTLGTLVLAFSVNQNGSYNTWADGEGVEIFGDVTPIEWLYDLAVDQGYQFSFNRFVEDANAGIAVAQLGGSAVIGEMTRFVSRIGAGGFRHRISMGRVHEPAVSAALDTVTSAIFSQIGKKHFRSLQNSIYNDAVTFSKWARNPAKMGHVKAWWEYAQTEMLASQSVQLTAGDPFWFLWAAPYVSGEYPKEGGIEQRDMGPGELKKYAK